MRWGGDDEDEKWVGRVRDRLAVIGRASRQSLKLTELVQQRKRTKQRMVEGEGANRTLAQDDGEAQRRSRRRSSSPGTTYVSRGRATSAG